MSDPIELRHIVHNGIRMRLAVAGQGPLVLLLHGWPESWYSWRHQLLALANNGYRAVAPDMPGYGDTDRLPAVHDYNVLNLAKIVVGVLDALNERQAILVGHDWGATIAWHVALLYPGRFKALAALSVPFRKHSPAPPLEIYKRRFGDRFFYQLYFQAPGVAEREFDADPKGILKALYCSPDTPRHPRAIDDEDYRAGGWIGRLGEPTELPAWLSEADLQYYISEFTRAGFAGGIDYYRNIDRNWSLLAEHAETKIQIPTAFLAGDKDVVIGGATAEQLRELMAPRVPELRELTLLPNIGHWVQQEAAAETNAFLLRLCASLPTAPR